MKRTRGGRKERWARDSRGERKKEREWRRRTE
jgi:hypothetical protein